MKTRANFFFSILSPLSNSIAHLSVSCGSQLSAR
jgi:hypothetical protein